MKACAKCHKEKPASEFSVDSKRKDGFYPWCKACCKEKYQLWYAKNRIRQQLYARKWYVTNKDYIKNRSSRYYQENDVAVKTRVRKWREANSGKRSFHHANRRAAKMNATPLWLTAIHKAQIQEFYDIAKARSVQTGIRYSVDHIHPLQGKSFSGLHVPWNMQVIAMNENSGKCNSIPLNETSMFWRVSP